MTKKIKLKISTRLLKKRFRKSGFGGMHTGGWTGLVLIGAVSGLVTAVAEALGTFPFLVSLFSLPLTEPLRRSWCP